MGFLTGLLGDLVGSQAGAMFQESVGVKPKTLRKLTKMVGGKNLVMLGAGAAIGGAALASDGSSAGGGPSDWDAPRGPAAAPPPLPASGVHAAPPPPPPTAAPPPPPPTAAPPTAVPTPDEPAAALDSVDAIEAAVPNELAYAITRAMVAAALADGHLDDRERTLVDGRLDDSGLNEEQIAQIRRDLVLPPQADALAEMVDDDEARAAVYRFAGLVVLAADGVSDLERAWLDRLASALGFDDPRREALEAELFEPDDFTPNDEV